MYSSTMTNALLPPVSSQSYSFGNSEVQIPNLDGSMSMESKIFSFDQSVHGGGSFYFDSKCLIDDENQLADAGFGLLHQSYINYPPVSGFDSSSSTCDIIEAQQPLVQRKNEFVDPWVQLDFEARQLRTMEDVGLLPIDEMSKLVEKRKTNKRKRINSIEEEYSCHQIKDSIKTTERKAPVRRSQRLSDKITALQKLVSPYGKTDTAAVLQEAVLSIKLLQNQIQNIFRTLRTSHHALMETGGQTVDLKSRGLCLVPLSLMRRVSLQEDPTDPHFITRESILAGEF